MVKVLLLLLLGSCSSLKEDKFKQLNLENLYNKKFVSIEDYLKYMNSRDKKSIKNSSLSWLKLFIDKDKLDEKDLEAIRKLRGKDLDFIRPIFASIALGKVSIFNQLCNYKETVMDEQGNNPLHLAAFFGKIDIVNHIIINNISKAKEWLREKNIQTFTPLHIAALMGEENILEVFLNNVKSEEEDILKNTSLELGLGNNSLKQSDLFSKENIHDKKLLLFYSLIGNNINNFKIIKDVNKIKDLSFRVRNGTLLLFAARAGSVEIFNYLISEGVPIEQLDNKGRNILYYAIKGRESKMIKIMREYHKLNIYALANKTYNNVNLLGYALLKEDNDTLLELMNSLNYQDPSLEKFLTSAIDFYMEYENPNKDVLVQFLKSLKTNKKIFNKILDYLKSIESLKSMLEYIEYNTRI